MNEDRTAVSAKRTPRTFTANRTVSVNHTKPQNRDGKVRGLMKEGMSQRDAEAYIARHSTGKKGKTDNSARKPRIKIVTTEPKKEAKPEQNRLDLAGYTVRCLVNDSGMMEGVIIAPAHRLSEGYFFVSDCSALTFLENKVENHNSFITKIIEERKKLGIRNNGRNTVDFVTSKEDTPSVTERSLLCEEVRRALTSSTDVISEELFLRIIFAYEKRLDYSSVREFIDRKLHAGDTSLPSHDDKELQPEEKSTDSTFILNGVKMKKEADGSTVLLRYPDNKSVEEYEIPSCVDTIESGAFRNIGRLQSVKIGSGVTLIRKEAFSDIASLVTITIPENVKEIEEGAFTRCRNLRFVIIRSHDVKLSSGLFFECRNIETVVTTNACLRNAISTLRSSSGSDKLKIVLHRKGQRADYPYLKHGLKITVMGNIWSCLTKCHQIKPLWVNVPVRENGIMKDAPICVYHCIKCNRNFILPDIYEYYLLRYNFVNTKLFIPLQYDKWYKGRQLDSVRKEAWGFRDKSILMEVGYTVASNPGYSQTTRLDIIRNGIEHGIVTKAEVVQHLQHLIDFNGSKTGNEDAAEKWREDLRTVNQTVYKKPKLI